jgi:hypothetical protein
VKSAVSRAREKRAIAKNLRENRNRRALHDMQERQITTEDLEHAGSGNANEGFRRMREGAVMGRKRLARRKNASRGKGKNSFYKLTGLGSKKKK